MMEYKGYTAKIEFDDDAGLFHGEVLHTRDVITFQGTSVEELRAAFSDSIEDYLEFCASRGEDPEKPFSGRFLVRVEPALHRDVAVAAARAGESLNSWVSGCLERATTPAPALHKIALAMLSTAATSHTIEYSKRITSNLLIDFDRWNDCTKQRRANEFAPQEKLVHRQSLDPRDVADRTLFTKRGYASVS